MQLLPVVIVAVVLLADAPPMSDWPHVALPWWLTVVVAFGAPLMLVGVARLVVRGVQRRIEQGDGVEAALHRADRAESIARMGVVLCHVGAVFALGWVEAVRGLIGDVVVVDEMVAVLPPIAGLAGLWWAHYPLERRLRDSASIRRFDAGEPVHETPTRWRYVWMQARMQLLLLVPILLIVGASEVIDRLAGDGRGWVIELGSLAAAGLIFMVTPWLARFVLQTSPLDAGSLRDDLEAVADAHRVGIRRILLWRTDGLIVNAAVMGVIAPLRYVLLTDGLLERLEREQVIAVMAHEIGHVRRRHLPWLLVVLFATILGLSVGMSLMVAGVSEMFDVRWSRGGASTVETAAMVGLIGAGLVVFGWVSRRFERQADTFAAQHLSAERASGVIEHDAVATVYNTLGRVARLNAADIHKRSWRHGSIAWRQDYLETLIGQRVDEIAIDRSVRRIKLASAVVLVGALAVAWWGESGREGVATGVHAGTLIRVVLADSSDAASREAVVGTVVMR